MTNEKVPADYMDMAISEAQRFDKMVRENFMPAIVSTAKQIIEDYGILEGICIDVGSGTAIFAIELARHSNLKIYGLENAKAIYEVARKNIENEGLTDRIIPVMGDAHDLPFEDDFAKLIISRGAYHCWKDKVLVFKEIYRILKRGGIGFVGGGFGRYISKEELDRMTALRDRSLKDDAKAYRSPKELEEIVRNAGISAVRIIYDKSGLWAELKK